MKRVNIYTYTTAKSPKASETQCEAYGYIVECDTTKGPATVSDISTMQGVNKYQLELRTLINALRRINTMCEVHVYLDCDYVAAGFTKGWIEQWKANGWMTATKREVKNSREWNLLDHMVCKYGHQIEFHVKEPHTYRNWLTSNVEKEKRKCSKNLENLIPQRKLTEQ